MNVKSCASWHVYVYIHTDTGVKILGRCFFMKLKKKWHNSF